MYSAPKGSRCIVIRGGAGAVLASNKQLCFVVCVSTNKYKMPIIFRKVQEQIEAVLIANQYKEGVVTYFEWPAPL